MNLQIINPKPNQTFAPIPNWLARRDEISWNAKGVYARLCQYADENGIAYPRVSTLAKECGLQQRTCERALKELRDNDLIYTYRSSLDKTNSYVFFQHLWMDNSVPVEIIQALELNSINKIGLDKIKNMQPTMSDCQCRVPTNMSVESPTNMSVLYNRRKEQYENNMLLGEQADSVAMNFSAMNMNGYENDEVVMGNTVGEESTDRLYNRYYENDAKPLPSSSKASKKSTKTKFDENFNLTPDWHAIALEEGIHPSWVDAVFEEFKEYWCNLSGSSALKSDWKATWRNRCRDQAYRRKYPKPQPQTQLQSTHFNEFATDSQAQEPVVNTDDKDERISNVKKRMLKNIGAFEYRNWIENLRFEICGNSLKVYANTQFVADWVKRVYATTIKACSTFDSVEVIFASEHQVQQQQQQQQQAGQAYYAIDADPRIRDMRQKICNRLGAAFYRSNIERAKIEVTGNFMKIYVKNKHCVSYIERRLPSIYAALENVIGRIEVGIDSDRMGWKGIDSDRIGWKGVA